MIKKLPGKTVVMVGGGLTAGLAARQLTGKNIDVLVLERGTDHSKGAEARLPTQRDELRWDTHQGLVQDWSVQTYTLRYSGNEMALPVRWMEAFLPGEGLGGAANHWNGHTWRWSEYDPEIRSRNESRYGKAAIPKDMPLQDWGTTYKEMRPYHELFEKLFGIAGKAGNINGKIVPGGDPFEAPRDGEYAQKPLELTLAGMTFKAAAEQLGYKPFPTPAANSSSAYTNPDGMKLGACQYCGHCERFICEAQAKASPEVLLYPLLKTRKNFEARLNCHVLGLTYDRAGKKVTGVHYVDRLTGQEYEQPADVVMLGAFTMTNTKLLLTSKIGTPYDPVSQTGVVGKNFCYQLGGGINLFMKDKWFNPYLATGSTQVYMDEFNNDNFDHAGLGFLGGAGINASMFSGRPIAQRRLPPGTPRWGTAWKKANADWYQHSMNIGMQGSCYPHRENYIDLDPTYSDAYGQPLIRMNFDWRENELKLSKYVAAKQTEIAKVFNADIVSPASTMQAPFDIRYYQSTHITGGTIMGKDPGTSVVSPHLQHWDAQNLFVVGASVFAHNSGYNPTGPLAALALRVGDDMAAYIERPRIL
jgi:gluconate 2-dehydrogenase alpha chain